MQKKGTGNRLEIKDFCKKAVVFGIALLFAVSVVALVGETAYTSSMAHITTTPNAPMGDLNNFEIDYQNPFGPLAIEWDVRLDLNEDLEGTIDNVVFGEAPDANDGPPADSYDQPKPPASMPPYVRAWFDDGLPVPYNIMWKDYRELNSKNYKEWNLTIQWMPNLNINPTNVNISWDPTDFDDSNFEYDSVILYDESNSVEVDMLINSYYNFSCPTYVPQNFKVNCTVDVDPPEITDDSPGSGTTGDPYTFNATVTDNIFDADDLNVKVNWLHGSLSGNDTMANVPGTNYFNKAITLDESISDLTYHFYANDSAKVPNSNYTDELSSTVTDNDPPVITGDSNNVAVGTGDTVTLWVTATDNIGVTSAEVSIDSGAGIAMTWDAGDSRWEYDYTAPLDDDSDHTYDLTVYDDEVLSDTSGPYNIVVTDNDNPSISNIDATPDSQIVDGYVNITATVTDNINIDTVKIDITGPTGFTPLNTSMIENGGDTYYYNNNYSIPGIYNYSLCANDTSSNSIVSAMYQFEIVSQYKIRNMFIGWNFVSMPFNQSINKTNLFVNYSGTEYNWTDATNLTDPIINPFIYGWDGSTYQVANILKAAHGYWIYAYKVCELWATNISYRAIDGYITNLSVGWSAIGAPVDYNVNKSKLLVYYGGEEYNWSEASNSTNQIVLKTIYYYDGAYQEIDELLAGESHWVYAYKECVLKWNIG